MLTSPMERLASLLAPLDGFAIYNDATDRIVTLQDELARLDEQLKNLKELSESENRAFTQPEADKVEELLARFEFVENEIAQRTRMAAAEERLSKPGGRKTDPDDRVRDAINNAPGKPKVYPQLANPRDKETWGFRHLGEFANSVRAATGANPGHIDTRLIANAAPASYGSEGTGGDGGWAVPPEFRQQIMVKVLGEASLLSRTDQQQSSSNQLVVPKDETTPWQTTGGVLTYWEAEAAAHTPSKPSLEPLTVRLNKLVALVPMTDELLEDAAAMAGYLRTKVPQKFDYKITNSIVRGSGAGQPLGILNSPAKVEVAKESGQVADTIVAENIINMWSRLYSGCRPNAVWIINQDIEPQLMTMGFPTTATAVPIYLPAGGLSAAPFATLLGKPVIATEAGGALGDVGDIILADLSTFLTVQKVGGIRQDVSIHLYFDYDITTFRFVMRLGGQPWWSAAITPANGSSNTRSCFITLAAR